MTTAAREDGITHIFATPHYMPGSYENKAGAIREALTRLREQVPKDIELLPGSDVRIMPDLPELVGTDDAVRETQRARWDEVRIVAEPAGATGLAALRAGAYRPAPGERE